MNPLSLYSNSQLFEECYLAGSDADYWHSRNEKLYFMYSEDWLRLHEEIRVRGLELAYMDYFEKRELMGV